MSEPGAEEQQPRDDLAELRRRRELTEDAARPDAVERRHAAGGRTARENVEDLIDPGSWVEYGRFAIAPQRGRRELDDLIARTPADGLLAGTARVDGVALRRPLLRLHGPRRHPGSDGPREEGPAVRADRADAPSRRLLCRGRRRAARATPTCPPCRRSTRGHSPSGRGWRGRCRGSAIVKGRCFAGNAVIAGCSDLIIATEDASIGMGGPAMIAGRRPRGCRSRRGRAGVGAGAQRRARPGRCR